ncbi:MAG: DNA-binding transcriptional ArsR family regulator [Planctomycetota bacterium]|jgi:DNA-binding transcriptional ArsR family regulator
MKSTSDAHGKKGSKEIDYRWLERVVKGFANHRRIAILFLIERQPELSVEEIGEKLSVNHATISDHLGKLARSGLVMKRNDGRSVRHKLTDRGKVILTFCQMLV